MSQANPTATLEYWFEVKKTVKAVKRRSSNRIETRRDSGIGEKFYCNQKKTSIGSQSQDRGFLFWAVKETNDGVHGRQGVFGYEGAGAGGAR
jgi:hypothetical protein